MIAPIRFFPLHGWATLLALLALAPVAPAQEAQQPRTENGTVIVPRIGMEIFRYLLHARGIEPLDDVQDVYRQPDSSIIILLGPKSIEQFLNEDMAVAVARGAAILIASDQPAAPTQWFSVQITRDVVRAGPNDCYHGLASYPFVKPFPGRSKAPDSPHTIFKEFDANGKNAIATNEASVLRLVEVGPEILAGYPASSRLLERRFEPQLDFFAVGGKYGEGRVLVQADHSVFINRMLWKIEDNANLKFTENCIDWLQGPEKNRKRCLFVEDGVIKTNFALPLPEPKNNWLELLLSAALVLEKHGDQVVSELEGRDFFNKLVLTRTSQREIVRSVLIAITLLLLGAGFLWLLHGRTRPDPARTLVTPDLAALIPRGSVLQQRFDGQLEAENVYESARRLVREFLSGLDAEPDEQGQPPRLEIKAGCQDEARLRQRIMRLWRIAYGSTPQQIKPRDWPELADDLKEVLEDADNGWWKFVSNKNTS